MDKKKNIIFIDSNVFIIDLRYSNDANFNKNKAFLNFIGKSGNGVTSIINLLEVCGILSFNLNSRQLQELFYYLPEKFGVDILPSHSQDIQFPSPTMKDIMELLKRKASLGDALIAHLVNSSLTERALFISWDSAHFKDMLIMKALTPDEFIKRQK